MKIVFSMATKSCQIDRQAAGTNLCSLLLAAASRLSSFSLAKKASIHRPPLIGQTNISFPLFWQLNTSTKIFPSIEGKIATKFLRNIKKIIKFPARRLLNTCKKENSSNKLSPDYWI
jgi:hypothetical protein